MNDTWEIRKNYAMLIAYQVANLTMVLGFFLILFFAAQQAGLL